MDKNPYIIKTKKFDKSKLDVLREFRIHTADEVYKYERLLHYCSFQTLDYIVNHNTFRCSSLNNATLNDQFEAKRKNVENFAGSRFITCFSHCQHEVVPFWYNYGGYNKKRKVILKVKNFSNYIADIIHMDHCLLPSGKKMFFYCKEYGETINRNGLFGQIAGLPPINLDYDTKACIERIFLFDIQYLPLNHEIFTQDYSREVNLISSDGKSSIEVPLYDTTKLGKHKTEHWEYEQETRLMCITSIQDFNGVDYIDLRLKERFFEDLEIIMCPWAEDTFYDEIRELLNRSNLHKNIKNTIKIIPSELHGQVI